MLVFCASRLRNTGALHWSSLPVEIIALQQARPHHQRQAYDYILRLQHLPTFFAGPDADVPRGQ